MILTRKLVCLDFVRREFKDQLSNINYIDKYHYILLRILNKYDICDVVLCDHFTTFFGISFCLYFYLTFNPNFKSNRFF